MANHVLAGIALPALAWLDEFDHTPVVQSLSRLENGVLLREESALVAGRPITLEGGPDYAWASRALVQLLYALVQTASAPAMQLTLADGRSFDVVWRREGGTPPLSARPIEGPLAEPDGDTPYQLTLRLVTV